MFGSSKASRWSAPDGVALGVPSDEAGPQDFARLQNAADFVIRTVLEVVPEPASGSAWLSGSAGLTQAAFVGKTLASREALVAYMMTLLGEETFALDPTRGGVRILGPVVGYFSAAMVLPVLGPTSTEGYLFFTSDVPGAFDLPQQGLARRMAAHLGQYWAR